MGDARAVGWLHLPDVHKMPCGETMKHRNHDTLVAEFDAAIGNHDRHARSWCKEDPSFAKCHRADLKDLKKGLALMKQGKYKKAYIHISGLDTNVREIPPDSVWNVLVESSYWQE